MMQSSRLNESLYLCFFLFFFFCGTEEKEDGEKEDDKLNKILLQFQWQLLKVIKLYLL